MGHREVTKRRGLRLSTAALAFASVSSLAGAATAQSLDQEFAEGFELNPIEPAPAGDRFFLVPGGFSDPNAPEDAGPVRGMLLAHYSLGPSLTRTDNETQETRDIVQNQLYLHANFTGYLLPWLMVNADLPFAAVQRGEGPLAPSSAVGDLRIGARFGVLGKRSSAFAVSPGIDLWLPTGSPDQLTGDESTRTEPYVSIGGQASILVYAAKLGVQFRNPVYTGSLEVGTSMTYGASAGISLFDNIVQVGPELQGRTLMGSQADQAFSGSVSPMTGLLGARSQIGSFNLGAGYGVGLTEAPGMAPRGMVSLTYNPIKRKKKEKPKPPPEQEKEEVVEEPVAELEPAPEPVEEVKPEPAQPPPPVDSDGDNIPDNEDACPNKLGDTSNDPKTNGCPYQPPATQPKVQTPAPAPTAPRDTDGDGIPDSEDSCPTIGGVRQTGNAARHGCPAAITKAAPAPKRPPAVVHKAPAGPPTATWVGFRELGPNRALVYVNLTEAVAVSSETRGNRLIFTLKDTRVAIRNNRNPLLAQHFGTVVKTARLVPKGKDTQLVIVLNGPATPNSQVLRETQRATLQVELIGKPKTKKPAN